MTNVFRNKLFSIIRCGMDIETPAAELSAADCTALLKIGKRQAILPIIHRGLKRMGEPDKIVKDFNTAGAEDIFRSIVSDYSVKNISAALNKEQIPYVLLKGSTLRNLYPEPSLRTSADVDILVYEEGLDQAIKAIENYTDFRMVEKNYHDVSMVNSHIHLELHFSIKENMENIDKLLSNAWNHARATEEGSEYVFTPEFQIFHVVAHMSYHFLRGGLGIRPLLDLWLLRTKTQYNETAIQSMCFECGILKFYEECCNLICVWFGNRAHSETTQRLEQFCLSGGVFGSTEFKNAVKQREHRKISYLFSRVFPPASQVREYYADIKGQNRTLAYYYVKRWISWFHRRRLLREQIGEIMSTDKNFIDKTDDLLERLGMRNI